MKKKLIYLIILALFVIVLSAGVLWNNKPEKITNFEECAAAGYPVMESYPRQCIAKGQTFVEKIYTEIYGTVSFKGELSCPCFLVNGVEVWYDLMEGKPAVDVSDINNGDFVVVKGELQENEQFWAAEIFKATQCTEEDRKAELCITLYDPVCGMPVNQTFSNSCFACIDERVIYYTEGEC